MKLPVWLHKAWHLLISNSTPIEVVYWIVNEVAPPGFFRVVKLEAHWDDKDASYSLGEMMPRAPELACPPRHIKGAWRKVFGDVHVFWAVVHVVEEWSPPGYWKSVVLKGTETVTKGGYSGRQKFHWSYIPSEGEEENKK